MPQPAVMLLAALYLGSAPAPLPGPPGSKGDLKKMQGTWELVSYNFGGRTAGEGDGLRVVIAGDRMTLREGGGRTAVVWALTLDATKAPRAIDRKGVGGDARGLSYRGVYRLDGDTLTLCEGWPAGSRRPADFRAGPGRWRQVFRRVKP